MSASAIAIPEVRGQSLCGTVSVTLTQTKPEVDVCHCSMCRKWGGGPFMGVSAADFTVSGADNITAFPSSSWAERGFCQTCGSNLYFRFLPSDHYSFCAGLFDFGEAVRLDKQIFVDEKPSYYDFAQETPMQTGAEVIAEAIAQGLMPPQQTDQ